MLISQTNNMFGLHIDNKVNISNISNIQLFPTFNYTSRMLHIFVKNSTIWSIKVYWCFQVWRSRFFSDTSVWLERQHKDWRGEKYKFFTIWNQKFVLSFPFGIAKLKPKAKPNPIHPPSPTFHPHLWEYNSNSNICKITKIVNKSD